jgi:hypothetical protein
MRLSWQPFLLGVLVLLFVAAPLLAHHYGGTVYDPRDRTTLEGTVTKVEWQNPHVYYYFDAVDESGNTVNWEAESGPPNSLYRRGWRKDDMKPGDRITVENAALARDGSNKISGGDVILANGTKVFSGSRGDGLDQTNR